MDKSNKSVVKPFTNGIHADDESPTHSNNCDIFSETPHVLPLDNNTCSTRSSISDADTIFSEDYTDMTEMLNSDLLTTELINKNLDHSDKVNPSITVDITKALVNVDCDEGIEQNSTSDSPEEKQFSGKLGAFKNTSMADLEKNFSLFSTEDEEFDFLKAEQVKRSASLKTNKTPPGTPSRKKAVRFADAFGLDLESVKHILNIEEPPVVPSYATKDLIISNEQPQSTIKQYLTMNFSQPAASSSFLNSVFSKKISLENCIIEDKTITGTARVSNLSYHKLVKVRYTIDNWTSFTDVNASYVLGSNDGGTDKFSFTITVPFSTDNKIEFCLMYICNGNIFWDNNEGKNYTILCYESQSINALSSDSSWLHFV